MLRIYGLNAQGLGGDELFTWKTSAQDSLGAVIRLLVEDVHPPGYQIFMFYVERLFGESESAVRGPSVVAGILSIPLIFFLGRQFFTYKEGLVAAGLLTFLAPGIQFSQEARAYELLMMFGMILTMLLLRMVGETVRAGRPRLTTWIAFAVTVLIVGQLHYYGFILAGVYGLYLLVRFLPRARFLIPAAAFLPLLATYGLWMGAVSKHMDRGAGDWLKPPSGLSSEFMEFLSFVFTDRTSVIAPYVLSLLLVSVILEIYRRKTLSPTEMVIWSERWVILLATVLGPFLIGFVASFIIQPMLYPRFMMVAVPAMYLMIARSIFLLRLPPAAHTLIAVALISTSSFIFLVEKEYYTTISKEQARDIVEWTLDDAGTRKDTAIVAWAFSPTSLDYYFEHFGSKRRAGELLGEAGDIPKLDARIKEWKRDSVTRFWFIRYQRMTVDPTFFHALEERGRMVKTREFLGGEAWLFELQKP